MGRWSWSGWWTTALGVALAVVLSTGVAQAKSWLKLAPDPLASDSAYAAMQARPADSLDVDQLAWFEVQRDWRAQRRGETSYPSRSLTASGVPHHARPGDARFAALASKPYASLTDRERYWLVTESAAQRAARESDKAVARTVGFALLAAIAGAVAATAIFVAALNHAFGQ